MYTFILISIIASEQFKKLRRPLALDQLFSSYF